MTAPAKNSKPAGKFAKGKSGNPVGRKAGTPNKTTALLKDAIIKAAEAVGQDGAGKQGLMGYCKFLAASEPKAFAGLLGKVLPMQITGEGDGAVVVEIRRYAAKPAK